MYILLISIIIFIFIISIFLIWLNLPRTFFFIFITFLVSHYSSFNIISQKSLLIILIIFILFEIIEFCLTAITVKIYGGNNLSALLSIIGAFLGAIIGSFIIPIIGSLIGLIVGAYLFAYFNEKKSGNTNKKSIKIANSTTLGYIFSKSLKSCGVLFYGIYLIKLL